MFFRKLPDLAEKSSDRAWKILLVLSKLNPCCLEENFESFVGKKNSSNNKFRKLSNFFLDFFRKFFDRLSKLLPLSCPDVFLMQNFFLYWKNVLFINFRYWANFLLLLREGFQRSCKNCVSCVQTVVLREIMKYSEKNISFKLFSAFAG